MQVLQEIEPLEVMRQFEALCAIPHGSRNTKAISDYCVDFAVHHGLEVHQDALGNVIIIKPATPGYEHAGAVIVQGHLDMVCQTAPDCQKDMTREGLELAVEGDFVLAKGTTLGGDDGIAVAMALALLGSRELPHPRLEAVFTVDEEIGMPGATALDVSPLTGRRMMNIDSEAEGVFTVGCAGGATAGCRLAVERAPFAGAALRIAVGGLAGGHSGMEIHKGRGNAIALVGRLLEAAESAAPVRLVSLSGGGKDNAIPAAAQAVVVTDDAAAVERACAALAAELTEEYRLTDAGLTVTVTPEKAFLLPMTAESTVKVICALLCLPNGVEAMSADIPGLVQTSLNLGIACSDEAGVTLTLSVRSSLDSQKQMLLGRIRRLMAQLGGTVEISGAYSGWAYRPDSPLRDLLCEVYRQQTGKQPRIETIHAGLECGIFAHKLPGLDCVSFGPDLLDIHTCRERMSISSVQRVWAMVTEALRRMK